MEEEEGGRVAHELTTFHEYSSRAFVLSSYTIDGPASSRSKSENAKLMEDTALRGE